MPRLLILSGVALIVVWLLITAVRIARPVASLLERETEARALAQRPLTEIDLVEAERLMLGIHQDIRALEDASAGVMALGPLLAWVPKLGPTLEEGPALLEMAEAGSLAGVHALRGAGPAFELLQGESESAGSKIPALVAALDQGEAEFGLASAALDQLIEARQQIEAPERLPWRIRSLLAQLDAELPLARDGLRLAPVLPELLGRTEPRAYLIIAQNEDELRATGGFITGAGYLVIDQGNVLALEFEDANVVDDWRNKPYADPPMPFTEMMGMDIFLFRDANFWPDFPATAEQAMQLYSYGQDVPLDGAIAIDQKFVQMLLSATGPIQVPALELTASTENVIEQMRAEWGANAGQQGWIGERKAFMRPLADAIRRKLEADFFSLHPAELARTLQAAAEQRHLQVYVRDLEVAAALNQTAYAGRQMPAWGQDFLLAVDTNLGFNKVSRNIKRRLEYQIELRPTGGGDAQLLIHYTNASRGDDLCEHYTTYTATTRYGDLTQDCHYSYVRTFAPVGSQLTGWSEHPIPAVALYSGRAWSGDARQAQAENSAMTVFDQFLLLARGQSQSLRFDYELPASVVTIEADRLVYRLEAHKQAGAQQLDLTVRVTIPEGRQVVSVSPATAEISGRVVAWVIESVGDVEFEIQYR
ncbi:MAG: DUF4012 domain-containing protein [Candidatus Promineifilaceae bacterium]